MKKAIDITQRVIKQGIKILSLSYSVAILTCVLVHHGWIGTQVTITEEIFSQYAHSFVAFMSITYILLSIFISIFSHTSAVAVTENNGTTHSERPFYRLYCDAIHEAAHAVVAEKLGLTVEKITLQPTADTRGHIELEEPADGFYSIKTVEARIKVCMAGILAEYIICQNLNDGGNMKNSDLNQIEELINLYLLHTDDEALLIPFYGSQERIRERAKEMNIQYRQETKKLILEHQEEIRNKAKELIEDYRRNHT